MKEKYIKTDTKKTVFAEQPGHVTRRGKKNEEDEVTSSSAWRIEHEDGFVTSLSNEKFLKRYTKA